MFAAVSTLCLLLIPLMAWPAAAQDAQPGHWWLMDNFRMGRKVVARRPPGQTVTFRLCNDQASPGPIMVILDGTPKSRLPPGGCRTVSGGTIEIALNPGIAKATGSFVNLNP